MCNMGESVEIRSRLFYEIGNDDSMICRITN